MKLQITFLSFLFGMVLSQTPCGMQPSTITFTPIVMEYTPYMPPQIGPTSTIYETLITNWFNAVDCRYVTPLRIDENPTPQGPFTTFVRSSILTVSRVGCMPETTAVTRRDFRGKNQLELRSVAIRQEDKIQKRRPAEDAIAEIVNTIPNTFPPDSSSLTVQAYRYVVSANTAIFAINLVQSGIDLNQTCQLLRDPASEARLFRTTIDPIQAGDIVCFAANNGLYFPVPVSEIITYLEDVIYALQIRSNYPANSTDFCWPLETADSPWLGVDTEGIAEYLCPVNGPTASPSTISTTGPTSSASTGIEGSATTIPPPRPTGGPYANTTAIEATSSPGFNTNPTVTSYTATPAPYANTTTEASAGESSAFSTGTAVTLGTGGTSLNATYTGAGTSSVFSTGNLPAVSTAVSPSIESVGSTSTHRLGRWNF